MKNRSRNSEVIGRARTLLKNQNGFTELWCIFMLGLLSILFVGLVLGYRNLKQVEQEKVNDEPIYEWVGIFSEGLASARKEPFGKYGYIEREGNVVIDFQFVSAGSFSEGLASIAISKNGDWKYGYINKEGEIVIEPQYDWGSDFRNGQAKVKENFHEYIIDTEGNIIEELKD